MPSASNITREAIGPPRDRYGLLDGWAGLKNGELLQAAESAGIEVLVTGDQTLNYEQNLGGRRLAIVALSAIQLPIIKSNLPAIITAIDEAAPGSFQVIECGTFRRRKPAGVIGLKRHTVDVVKHDPNWRVLAADACQAVRKTCGELLVDLQHVGSTAVPDLPAKPVLDIAAAVATLDSLPELIQRLTLAGYLYRGDHGNAGGQVFVAESLPDVRTVHLHVVEHDDSQWRNYILFRDLLRSHCCPK